MENLLKDIGISNFNSFVYEYEPIKLSWWDTKHKTSVEIEIHQDEDDLIELTIYFCPETEGIIERTIVFLTTFNLEAILNRALIMKEICEKTIGVNGLKFSKEENAYIIDSFDSVKKVVQEIGKLIENKNPIYILDFNENEEILEEDIEYETGDSLGHFIGMMSMNSITFTEENIIEYLKLGIDMEGEQYLKELKEDIESNISFDFNQEYKVDIKVLDFIMKTINKFENK